MQYLLLCFVQYNMKMLRFHIKYFILIFSIFIPGKFYYGYKFDYLLYYLIFTMLNIRYIIIIIINYVYGNNPF